MAAFLFLIAATVLKLCFAQNVSTFNFLSRPDIKAPTMNVSVYNENITAAGYILLTPNPQTTANITGGPMIYDSDGNLVWFGSLTVEEGYKGYDLQVGNWQGSPHLVWTNYLGPPQGGPGGPDSETRILDSAYKVVQTVRPSGQYQGQNLTEDYHEFHLKGPKGATALISSYVTVPHSATYPACNGSTTAYISTGVFSEVTTDGTNREIFQWSAIDHVDLQDTYVCPGQPQVGTGQNSSSAFDFFHINAVDKDATGDYLVSSRHTWTIYKIAGLNNTQYAAGTVIWRLGGKSNTFASLTSSVPGTSNLTFSFQHHSRFHPKIPGISIWDNANNGFLSPSASISSGKVIRITSTTSANGTELFSADLVAQYLSPSDQVQGYQLDSSQGSHQFLPNGNHLLGDGSDPAAFEYTNDGTLAWYGSFGALGIASYRAFRHTWTGKPGSEELALFAYARSCNASEMAFYASWNGATEVDSWKFYSGQEGTFQQVAEECTEGKFETSAMGQMGASAYAEALDLHGVVLGRTETVQTFVPGLELVGECGDAACPWGTNYTSAERAECGES